MTHTPSPTHRPRRTRGFSLMHIMIVFPLLGVFMLIASKLFLLNNTMLQESTYEQERLGRADAAIHRLRLDVMLAREARLSDNGNKLFLEHRSTSTAWAVYPADGDLAEHRPCLFRAVTGEAEGDTTRRYAEVGEAQFELVPTGVVLVLQGERYLCPFGSPGMEAQP